MHFNILWCEHSINATLSRYCERFCIETVMHWICTKSVEEALVLVIEHQLFDSMFVHIGAESQPWDHLNGTNPTLNKSRCRPFAYICTDIKCLHTIAIVIFPPSLLANTLNQQMCRTSIIDMRISTNSLFLCVDRSGKSTEVPSNQ